MTEKGFWMKPRPSPAATQTRQARGCQEFNGTWHWKLYKHIYREPDARVSVHPPPVSILTGQTRDRRERFTRELRLLRRRFRVMPEDGRGGIAALAERQQQPLGFAQRCHRFVPHDARPRGSPSLTRIVGPLERGGGTATSMYNRRLLCPSTSSASNAFFSLPFYHVQ